MTSEEYEVQIKILEAENKRLKDRIIELETAIKVFGQAIGEDV
jgi:chaperonin cofactor prefoldin|tara:strand:- start:194 stop:322 length:129 start_codon:yes stop_codon:yes gene_type:complete